jgi:hypothetical protein
MKFLGAPSSGSIAGTTYSHNRAGQYTRNRRSPVQPVGNGRRGVIKAAFSAASSGWSVLAAAVQAAWNGYAQGNPYTDSLGQQITLTGHQMFVAIATQCINCGLALPTNPPISNAVFAAGFSAFTAVHAGAITLTPTGTGAAGDFLLIAMSAPQSSGVGFCKTFTQLTHISGNVVAATVLTAAYTAQFGNIVAGQRLFYRLTPVNQYGVRGTPNEGFITVA